MADLYRLRELPEEPGCFFDERVGYTEDDVRAIVEWVRTTAPADAPPPILTPFKHLIEGGARG